MGSELKLETEETMLSCGPCSINHKTSTATIWCMECEEGLCTDCLEHHDRMRMSRSHTTIDAKQYENLPSFIHAIKTDCHEHARLLELYCPVHKCAWCVKCIDAEHASCSGITSLEHITDNVKNSQKFQEAERDIVSVLGDLEKIERNRSNNLNRLNEHELRIKSEITNVRTEINNHLDRLEKQIFQNLDEIKSKETSKIETVMKDIGERHSDLTKLQKDFKGIKLHATDLQAFYGLTHIDSILEKCKAYVQYIQKGELVSEIDFSFEQSPSVKLIMGRVSTFGKIKVSISHSKSANHPAARSKSMTTTRTREITLRSGKTSLTTIPEVNRRDIDVTKMSLLYQRRISIPVGHLGIISSITRLSDRKIIVTESSYKNGHLHLFNNVGRLIREIKVKGDPWDVTQLDESTIAVTYPDENVVKFVNFISSEVIDTIPVNRSCWGLFCDKDAIYVGLKGNEMRALDFFGNKIGSVEIKSRLENFYVTAEAIYFADAKKHTLNCASPKGDLLWSFTSEYMRGPRCVSLDKYGNIFVGCIDTHCILVVSPDRNKIRILLGKNAGIDSPTAIFCDKEHSMLLVSNRNGKFAAMYRIVYR